MTAEHPPNSADYVRPRLVLVALVMCALAACSVTSIDAVKDKQLNLCKQIRDEALRVQCITNVRSDGK